MEGWKKIALADFDYIKGFPFKSKDYKKRGTRIIRVSDIGNDELNNENKIFVNSSLKNNYKNWLLEKNDIIITTVGSKPPMYDSIVGKSLLITEKNKGGLLNQNNVLLKINEDYLSRIIYSNLKSKKYFSYITEIFRGNANQASITVNDLLKYEILIPQKSEEQKALANTFKNIDDLIDSLQKLINKKVNIRKGLYDNLLSGKNSGWQKVKLGELTSMNSGGTPNTQNPKYYGGKINWLSISDISSTGKYVKETMKKITAEGLVNSSARLFEKGTLFFAMYASIGKVTISLTDMACSQAILGMKCENINRDFLYHYLIFKNKELSNMGQTGTQSNLSKKIMEEYEVLVPRDLNEQNSIAKILNNIDAEIDSLQEKLNKYKKIKEAMVEELLTGKVRLNYE